MATAYNTEVRVYKNVPLIKGGVEVLFTHGNALGVTALNGFLYKTYTEYYYQREVRNAIQIDDTIMNLEGVNYIAWRNQSHGGVWFYAFVDSLAYINDNNTQINYTIDPFPTYLHECRKRDYVYVKRNTPKAANKASTSYNFRPDYIPESARVKYRELDFGSLKCNEAACFFVCPDRTIAGQTITVPGLPISYFNASSQRVDVGIKVAALTDSLVADILQNDGEILGAYVLPQRLIDFATSNGYFPLYHNWIMQWNSGLTLTHNYYNVFSGLNLNHGKTKTGVYNKLYLQGTGAGKYYNPEDFDNPDAIQFNMFAAMLPSPYVVIYPTNYKGFGWNVAEGIMFMLPQMPIAAQQVYSFNDANKDLMGLVGNIATVGVGAAIGGIGAVAGLGVNLTSQIFNIGGHIASKAFSTPQIESMPGSFGSVGSDGNIHFTLGAVGPTDADLQAIDNYFEYYGYAFEDEMAKNDINDTNGAYLQVGSEYCSGSEADVEINTRLANGIKIITSFT